MAKKVTIKTLIWEVTPYWAEVLADYLIKNGVVLPVRCKDCKNRCYSNVCEIFKRQMQDNCFCSYGERKMQ